MQWIIAHLTQIGTATLTLAELISLFLKNGNGTIAGIITALRDVGAKDVDGK